MGCDNATAKENNLENRIMNDPDIPNKEKQPENTESNPPNPVDNKQENKDDFLADGEEFLG